MFLNTRVLTKKDFLKKLKLKKLIIWSKFQTLS